MLERQIAQEEALLKHNEELKQIKLALIKKKAFDDIGINSVEADKVAEKL